MQLIQRIWKKYGIILHKNCFGSWEIIDSSGDRIISFRYKENALNYIKKNFKEIE